MSGRGATDRADGDKVVLPIRGPVEKIGGYHCLFIPLVAGGQELVPHTRGIATVVGDSLKVSLPDWMLKFLNIREGSEVIVDIVDGKFNVKSAEWKPEDPPPAMPS